MGRLLAFFPFLAFIILSATSTRVPRDGLNGQDVGVNIEWLTDGQLSELGEAEGQTARMDKLRAYFDAMEPGESKKTAAEKIVAECYNWVEEVAGEEGREELNRLHHSEHGKCKEKVAELLAQIEDEERRGQIEGKMPFCEHVWYSQHEHGGNDGEGDVQGEGGAADAEHEHEHAHHHHHRKRWAHRHPRDHFDEDDGEHEHQNLEDYLQSHLSWLSDEQKEELRGMKGQGKEAIQAKTMEYFESSTGEQRAQAIRQLQSGCRELIRRIFGGEKAAELRRMREQGAGVEEMEEKIKKMTDELEDEGKREKVREFGPACRKIFTMNSANNGRRRRDHHEGHDGHGAGGHEAHHGGHTLEDYYKTHLSWLTEAQREELKGMKGEGKSRAEMQQKVMEWYGQLEGEEKEKAGELLKGGCRELIKALLGEEKAEEVRKMKEAGTEPEKIGQKVDEWIGQLEEGRKKQMALEYAPTCRRLFGVSSTTSTTTSNSSNSSTAASRKRRSHHRHRHQNYRQREEEDEEEVELEDGENGNRDEEEEEEGGGDHHLDRHRSWLNGRQKKVLRGMRERGHVSHELHDKIHQFYEVSPDEVKATARGILQKGCEAILQRVFGDYKAEEIIQAKEEGASNAEIDGKIDEALAQIRNPTKREEAARFAMTCRRIFSMIERRRRREVAPGEKTIEELGKTHLSWLSDGQKEELRGMKEAGKGRTEMQQKVMEWFGQLEGEERAKALEKLRDGCRELLVFVLGKENAEELRRMKETGTGEAELEAKAQELIGTIGDEDKKTKAKEFGPTCKRIFLAN